MASTSPPLDDFDPVPPFFLGQARAARTHFHASVAVSPVMKFIAVNARRGAGGPRILDFTEARWRRLPAAGLVLQTIERSATVLSIRDVRAVDHVLSREAWGDAQEGGVCLCDNWLRLARPRGFASGAGITVALSLHSMGRWFQRQLGGAGNIEALTQELARLAEVAPALLAGREPDLHVETPSGAWHGHVALDVDAKRTPWVNVRTFY